MSISTTWYEQYERMIRGRDRLLLTASGAGDRHVSSDEARDGLYHFFQDAYHLKDWIKNGSAATKHDIESFINDTPILQISADLANGIKHLRLTRRARTGDATTAVVGQSVIVRPAAAGSGLPVEPALHSWRVHSGGQDYDACELANDIVAEWQVWLTREGLL